MRRAPNQLDQVDFVSFVLTRPLDRFASDQADDISQRVLNLKIAVAQKSSDRSSSLPSLTLLGWLTYRISNPTLTTGPSVPIIAASV
jgi:hypothetical protein